MPCNDELIDEAEEAADEAEWDAQFARSRDFLRKKAREALERDRAGLSSDED